LAATVGPKFARAESFPQLVRQVVEFMKLGVLNRARKLGCE
jgi:hypothetical protein